MAAEETISGFKPGWFHMCLSRLSLFLVIILFTLVSLCASVYARKESSCLSSTGDAAVRICEKELQQIPDNIAVRLALVDGLIQQHNYKKAAKVLREGLAIDHENQEFNKRLTMTEGFLDEQAWVEIQRAKQPSSHGKKIDPKVRADTILCTKLKGERALKACNAALESLPNDPELLRGKADALLSLGRTSEANSAYQLAKKMKGGQKKLRLQVSQTKIKFTVDSADLNQERDKCFNLDELAGIQACKAALLSNTGDKFDIWQRQGELLLETNNKTGALQAFQQAEILQPSNMAIKDKIASLSPPKKEGEQTEVPRKEIAPVYPPEEIVAPSEPQEEIVAPSEPQEEIVAPSEPQEEIVAPSDPQEEIVAPSEPQEEIVAPSDPQEEIVAPSDPQEEIVAPSEPQEEIVAPSEPQEESAGLKIAQDIIKRYSNAPLGKDATY